MPDRIVPTSIRPVWIASYPRSGNTFLRIVLQNIFHLPTYSVYYVEGQNFSDPSAEALEEAPVLPRNWRELISSEPGATLTLIKTHDPPPDDSPAIYLVRDGRAAIDSYFHYQRKFAFDKPSLTEVIAGACQFGAWSAHLRAWAPLSRPNTLFLRYEDLVNRPMALIPSLSEFLQVQPAEGQLPTFEELKQRYPAFFRRGQNEDFLKAWTPGQAALFNSLHESVMKELGYPQNSASLLDHTTVAELASSATRLHQQYLEHLEQLGTASAYCEQLMAEVKQLKETEAEQNRVLNTLLDSRWLKLGAALKLLKHNRPNRRRPDARADTSIPTPLLGVQNPPLPGHRTR